MLETQKYLSENGLEKLHDEYEIDITYGPDNLIILNYSQIGSKSLKFHPIIRECRSLCLENKTWTLVSKSMDRFFNLNEHPEGEACFDWKNSVCEEKCDGSHISLFWWNGEWRIITRSSFADSKPHPDYSGSWKDLFEEALGIKINGSKEFDCLDRTNNYIFELCSPWNLVVVHHEKPKLYLLTGYNHLEQREFPEEDLKWYAGYFGVERPRLFPFNNSSLVEDYFKKCGLKGNEFEGVIFKDVNFNRIKLKYEEYVKLHKLSGNGNITLNKNLIPMICEESCDLQEALLYLPGVKIRYNELAPKVAELKREIVSLWEETKDEPNQKTFALAVKDKKYCSILFQARKDKDLEKAWKASGEMIYERFFKN